MKIKHVFLTSGMIMAIATFPAISEDYYNSDIANSCQVDFLGGTGADNSTAPNSFQAQYTANKYTVSVGQYLAAGAITGTRCPANSYCPGGTFEFSETTNQGINSCPTGFTLSASGAITQSDCYHTCTASDVENGEKLLSGTIAGKVYQNGQRNSCFGICTTGYTFRVADFVSPFRDYEGTEGTGCAAKGNDGSEDLAEGGKTLSDYNLTQNGSWGTSFSYVDITGIASCNDTAGNNNRGRWDNDSSNWTRPGDTFTQDSTGEYCWCKITGYTPTGGTLQDLSASSSWVFDMYYGNGDDYDDADECAYDCAAACAYDLMSNDKFRPALLRSVDTAIPPACVANEINVNWYNGETLYETNQCTYDGAITLPTAPEKTGYTFTGWKLVTGSSN